MQQTFDWTRAEQLALVERWECPRLRGVSGIAVKAVLRAIDGFGRGREAWPSEATLAQVAGMSVRTVKRAIKALESLSLVTIERKGPQTVNHYRIVWTELACRAPENRRVNCPVEGSERSATPAERSATVSERSATLSRTKCHAGPLNDINTTKETTTTQELPVVVVSLVEVFESHGIARAREAYRLALASGLDDAAMVERVQAWELAGSGNPGILYNWLTRKGSYRADAVGEQPLRFARGLAPVDERTRADLVAYGKRQGWSRQRLQAAVADFERQHMHRASTAV